jgi:glycogen synthase kinase 3 beta
VALKRVEKVGNQLSREFEILLDVKDSDHVVKILVRFSFSYQRTFFTQEDKEAPN